MRALRKPWSRISGGTNPESSMTTMADRTMAKRFVRNRRNAPPAWEARSNLQEDPDGGKRWYQGDGDRDTRK